MTAPKQPNLTTDEKNLTKKLLDQERRRVRETYQKNNGYQHEQNALAFYHKHVVKSLNKIIGKKEWTEDL